MLWKGTLCRGERSFAQRFLHRAAKRQKGGMDETDKLIADEAAGGKGSGKC